MNAYYATWGHSRPDFNQLSAFIGSNIPDTEIGLEYLFVAPDDPDLVRIAMMLYTDSGQFIRTCWKIAL